MSRALQWRTRVVLLAVSAVLLLAACGGSPPPGSGAGATTDASAREASVRVGDVIVRASVLPTQSLGEAVAQQYGITRDASTVMLLIGVRRGSDAQEIAIPARMSGTATDLLGKRQVIDFREVRSGEFVDYVGTATVIAPDTLRFDVIAITEGKTPIALQFNRDFF